MNTNTILIDLPTRIKGYTVKNDDDTYSIFLNARMATEQLRKTYKHEIEHIKKADFDGGYVQQIEMENHN